VSRSPLRTRDAVERAIDDGTLADWKTRRYEAFHETMTDSFVCYFAVDAHEAGDMRYLFPERPDSAAGRETFATGLADYIDELDALPQLTSLVVAFEPTDEGGQAWYRERFWDLLEHLHRNDPAPWPDDVPSDPTDPQWTFCYAGEPLFLVARAPSYEQRHSRHTPHGLEVTIQPRAAFEGLTGDTPQGRRARQIIRDRLDDYDDAPRHPAIGNYGDPDSHEWKQYFLPDEDVERDREFPFAVDVAASVGD
jgi:hypothetical protein